MSLSPNKLVAPPVCGFPSIWKMSKKDDKRLSKKAHKARQMLQKQDDVVLASIPTMHLVVANGGLSNGVSREDLIEVFSPFGDVMNIVQEKGKHYGFVTFSNVEEAEKAVDEINGKMIREAQGKVPPLYFYPSFVFEVPGISLPSDDPPPGLIILQNFVTEHEEEIMLSSVDWPAKDSQATTDGQEKLKHRRVKHYGYEFLYTINNVDRNKPLEHAIPGWCDSAMSSLVDGEYIPASPDQLTVNQYLPGQGIPPHVDTHSAFEDGICSLSLGSQSVMEFRHPSGQHRAVVLPRRSMLIMMGESRYLWTHGITPRKFDVVPATGAPGSQTLVTRETRTSFTFRKILHAPCKCKYPDQCDSQNPLLQEKQSNQSDPDDTKMPQSAAEAAKMEAEHVHKVYEEIADHFSDTRHSPWPEITEFLRSQPEGSLVADVGCGNGKYLGINNKTYKIGCDRSSNLCNICADRGHPVFVADCLKVPLKNCSMDVAISIAVIHHLSTFERRIEAVKELVRILGVGGQGLVYVWAMEQKRNNIKSKYLKDTKHEGLPCTNNNRANNLCDSGAMGHQTGSLSPDACDGKTLKSDATLVEDTKHKLSVHTNRTSFQSQDLLVPWHLKSKTAAAAAATPQNDEKQCFHRYYHVFVEGELENLISNIPKVEIMRSYYDQGNWCVVFQKTTN